MTPTSTVVFAGCVVLIAVATLTSAVPIEQQSAVAQSWKTAWAASAHGPYPSGNATAQPILDFAFESPATGAIDQTFRLIVKPDIWGPQARIRFTNAFGTKPVMFDDAHIGLQSSGGAIVSGTNQRVTFAGGQTAITIEPGQTVFSDSAALTFVTSAGAALLSGRKLAVSVHVTGPSGPMTWHAKALTTSYLTGPKAGRHGSDLGDEAFPNSTTSWFFVDAVDMMAPSDTAVVVAFGDSITDGTASTINGDDRWPDVLARRLHGTPVRASVINAGIGGNRVIGPAEYGAATPFAGGPSALSRLERDVVGLSGVTTVIWLEGINDIAAGASAQAIVAGLQEGVARLHARGLRVVGATITSALGYTGASGAPEADERRRTVNAFIRAPGSFDGVADFDTATADPRTGALRAAYQPNSSTGGAGDKLHPNRAGYLAMGGAVDLATLLPGRAPAR